MKVKCTKCLEEKELTEEFFPKYKKNKRGFSSWCKKCMSNHTASYRKKQDKSILRKYSKQKRILDTKKGKCVHCKEASLKTSVLCVNHWIYTLLSLTDLTKEEKKVLVPLLLNKLEKSEYTCFYTGIPIIPGFSASLDHRIPKSKGGKDTIDNLEWVHFSINRLKQAQTELEFVDNYENILVELNYISSKGLVI